MSAGAAMAATAMVRTEARVENCILMELLVFGVEKRDESVEDAVGRCC